MLNYTILPQVAELDYYLERASVKLVNLFGTFHDVILFLFVAVVFCSFLLWLIIPIIELRKKSLLKKIYEQLVETQELMLSIKKDLSDSASRNHNINQ
jgi:hypothetical protein